MNINASLFVQMAVFFFGAWVTMKYIWPPLIRAIEERQKKIDEGLAAADKGEMALAEAQKEGQAIKAEARAQALAIMNDGESAVRLLLKKQKLRPKLKPIVSSKLLRLKWLKKPNVCANSCVKKSLAWLLPVPSKSFVAKLTLKFTLKCLNN